MDKHSKTSVTVTLIYHRVARLIATSVLVLSTFLAYGQPPVVPAGGNDPMGNLIIIAGGQEEASVQFMGGRGQAFSIDAWR